MSFLSGTFLAALVAVAGPGLIHLLNRRRHRTIQWGAMEFLREAIRRSRRLLRLRDLLLLLLRTLAVLLFVLAMARPFWAAGGGDAAAGRPIHAVLVVDNSLSMGYTPLDKSLLDLARDKAREFVKSLPEQSEISVIPLCGAPRWRAEDVCSTKEDALEALDRIEVVDRRAEIAAGLARAQRACRQVPEITTKRVVLLGDLQRGSWSLEECQRYLEGIPDIQVVQVSPERRTNTWVADFRLLHAIADAGSTAVFRATIRHEGPPGHTRDRVRVTLKIDGEVAAERHVDLAGGHDLQLDFRHRFEVAGTSAEPMFIPARLELSPDRLPQDDHRALIVPVVASVPVVFVDEVGQDEQPRDNRIGETAPLRLLLAPSAGKGAADSGLVRAIHRTVDRLTRADLREARLAVVAGVRSPTPEAVKLLREFVEQGGQVLLAAGAQFDPRQWTSLAWRDGAGILPAPLADEPIGRRPQPGDVDVTLFRLDRQSMTDQALHFGQAGAPGIEEIFTSPFFFKAVAADVEAARKTIDQAERKRVQDRRDRLGEHEADEKRWAQAERKGGLSADDARLRERRRQALARERPRWLAWQNPLARDPGELSVDEVIGATQPRVMGRYDNGRPFALRRDIGRGRVVMITTGIRPGWNNLALENSVLLLDRLARSLLLRSLPDRTFGPESEIAIPVDAAGQGADFTIRSPGRAQVRVQSVEALGAKGYGLVLRSLGRRGLYHIRRQNPDPQAAPRKDDWRMVLAVNGLPQESELDSLAEDEVPGQIGPTAVRWIGPDQKIRLEGKTYIDHDVWKMLMALALACLVLEMGLLTGWRPRRGVAR